MRRLGLLLLLCGCNDILGLKGGWQLEELDASPNDAERADVFSSGGDASRADAQVAPDGPVEDAGTNDAQKAPDARPRLLDANTTPDAFVPTHPPITNGQAADLVLGQPDFTSSTANNGGTSAKTLNIPIGLSSLGDDLWAFDAGNVRVLGWSTTPTVKQGAADLVVGQTSFTTGSTGPTQTILKGGGLGFLSSRVAISATALVSSDYAANRALIWSPVPTVSGSQASLVLGQTSFTASTNGAGLNKFNGASGVWTDGQRLVVCDVSNSRVLIWNTFPTANGQGADVSLGGTASPATASSMFDPTDVTSDGFGSSSPIHKIIESWFGIRSRRPTGRRRTTSSDRQA